MGFPDARIDAGSDQFIINNNQNSPAPARITETRVDQGKIAIIYGDLAMHWRWIGSTRWTIMVGCQNMNACMPCRSAMGKASMHSRHEHMLMLLGHNLGPGQHLVDAFSAVAHDQRQRERRHTSRLDLRNISPGTISSMHANHRADDAG